VWDFISDTHGLLRPEATSFLRDNDFIIHGGDIGNAGILDELRALAPITAVRGNIDKGAWAESLSDTEALQVGAHFIYVLHDLAELDIDPGAAGFRIVVSGHSHRPRIEEREGVLYMNPGSAGPRRFKLPDAAGELIFAEGKVYARIVDQPGTHSDLKVTQRMFHADTEPDWVAVTVGQPFYRPVETGCRFNYAHQWVTSIAPWLPSVN
jgi:putative phosphoesterase